MSYFHQAIQMLTYFFNAITHLDQHLLGWALMYQSQLYPLLFAIIFCETGLVITPFLPGDSLLFAIGAVASIPASPLKIEVLMPLLIGAGILGDTLNFHLGRWIGPKVFSKESSIFFNKNHLVKTQHFYEKYGNKTIFIARFIPIVRTFAPFVAGIGKMQYSRFLLYNIVGAVAWVSIFLVAGFWFGNIPVIKQKFHLVIFGIIIVSCLPPLWEIIKAHRGKTATTGR